MEGATTCEGHSKLGLFEVEEDAARNYDAAWWSTSREDAQFPGKRRAPMLAHHRRHPRVAWRLARSNASRPPRALPRGTTYPDGAMGTRVQTIATDDDDEDEDIRRGPAAFRGAWEARVRAGAAARDALETRRERRVLLLRQQDEAKAAVAVAATADLPRRGAAHVPSPTAHERRRRG